MHNINYTVYHCSKSEKQILKDLNTWAYDPQESSGYHGNMHFHRDLVFKNQDEAQAAIEKMDKGWYDDHAVMFKDGRKKFWLVKSEYHS